jgi:hypothetical protein
MSFHLSFVTLEFVGPKQFWSLWYVRHKTCTNLVSRLALSPNGLKLDSTRTMLPSSSIGCVQIDFQACGTFGAKHAPILCQDEHCLQMDRNELPHEPRHLGVWSGASKMIFAYVWHKLCTYLASRLALSSNRLNEFSLEPLQLWVPSGASKTVSKPIVHLAEMCTYLAPTLTLSPYGSKGDSTWLTSPSSCIRCVQNDFWAYSTFSAKRAPILCHD